MSESRFLDRTVPEGLTSPEDALASVVPAPDSREAWLLQQIEALESLVDRRCALILPVLQDKANDLTTDFTEAMLRERRRQPPSERGRIGLRVRTATTSAPGMFQIEWYRVQGKQRTKYLRRGKDKQGRPRMQYSLASFGRITDWEEALILHYEPQCARLRSLLHHLGQLRRDLRPLTADAQALLDLEPDEDAQLEIEARGLP
ncbi:conjugative transfer protein MobI(A/C) [Thiocystis violacea]|uniref:conjugative transfer protein MobI(A/C) n=1 Tax=Thiocystis violacea TaxID=13725 RepID=UPI001F5B4DF8|nr:conjugative transfer protein MobI(A/C) [Thiocystis violacea]